MIQACHVVRNFSIVVGELLENPRNPKHRISPISHLTASAVQHNLRCGMRPNVTLIPHENLAYVSPGVGGRIGGHGEERARASGIPERSLDKPRMTTFCQRGPLLGPC